MVFFFFLLFTESPEHELELYEMMQQHQTAKSHDDSHVSGVSPFQSVEDIHVSCELSLKTANLNVSWF